MAENFTYGYVTGTLVLSRGDGADEDRLPDAIGASGVTVTFTRDQRQYATANPPRLISHAPVVAKTMADGQITSDLDADEGVKPDAIPGLWLVTGTYRVSTSAHYPDFSIVVTDDHDETAPLDLALAVSYAPPAGVTVQTVALPAGASTGQVLTWGETGLSWGGGGVQDTGPRNISSLIVHPGMSAASNPLVLQRVGVTVFLSGPVHVAQDTSLYIGSIVEVTPEGFRPAGDPATGTFVPNDMPQVATHTTALHVWRDWGIYLQSVMHGPTTSGGEWILQATYITNDPWPETLPGVPA